MFRALFAPHQEVKTVLYCIWYHHTCRWPSCAQVERECTKCCFMISLLYASTCFEHCCAHHQQVKTASGIITTVGGRPVHRSTCAPDGHLHNVTIPDAV